MRQVHLNISAVVFVRIRVRVSVGHKKHEVKKSDTGETSVTQLGQYEQAITLPETVRSADMKVKRHDHEVVITIPKAGSS